MEAHRTPTELRLALRMNTQPQLEPLIPIRPATHHLIRTRLQWGHHLTLKRATLPLRIPTQVTLHQHIPTQVTLLLRALIQATQLLHTLTRLTQLLLSHTRLRAPQAILNPGSHSRISHQSPSTRRILKRRSNLSKHAARILCTLRSPRTKRARLAWNRLYQT